MYAVAELGASANCSSRGILRGIGEFDQALRPMTREDGDVNGQPDVFLGFIDDLAADLDDHESTADERAARHCLSRSHFDRHRAACACPATPRRRR